MEKLLINIVCITVTVSLVIASVFGINYCLTGYSFDNTDEQVIVLDYESQYYTMHCEAIADILARGGSNNTIETYLEITGAKIQ